MTKLKAFADDNFKFDENDRKLSKWVENIEGKEKLLITSNFSFSNSVFKRLVKKAREKKKLGLFGRGLMHLSDVKFQARHHLIMYA